MARGVLTLVGAQNIGKSRWFKSLLPEGYVKLGHHLQPADKDSVLEAIRYPIVEIGELDGTFRKSDMAALKAFLGRDYDLDFGHFSKPACRL